AMGQRVIGPGLAREIVRVWLAAEFAGGRHARRVDKIRAIEAKYGGPEAGDACGAPACGPEQNKGGSQRGGGLSLAG
ncbi:MAG: RpiB/LacA/LacB family sugar-phosphate isomerase, partial [Firmicutes bacterium]|nr:RpiB/LacA/LacB family sugar-phosphate isomerase [Bacillota bacterium]